MVVRRQPSYSAEGTAGGDSSRWQIEQAIRQSEEALERVTALERVMDVQSSTVRTQFGSIESMLKEQEADLKKLVTSEIRRTEREATMEKLGALTRWAFPLILGVIPMLVGALWWVFTHAAK